MVDLPCHLLEARYVTLGTVWGIEPGPGEPPIFECLRPRFLERDYVRTAEPKVGPVRRALPGPLPLHHDTMIQRRAPEGSTNK